MVDVDGEDEAGEVGEVGEVGEAGKTSGELLILGVREGTIEGTTGDTTLVSLVRRRYWRAISRKGAWGLRSGKNTPKAIPPPVPITPTKPRKNSRKNPPKNPKFPLGGGGVVLEGDEGIWGGDFATVI